MNATMLNGIAIIILGVGALLSNYSDRMFREAVVDAFKAQSAMIEVLEMQIASSSVTY